MNNNEKKNKPRFEMVLIPQVRRDFEAVKAHMGAASLAEMVRRLVEDYKGRKGL